MFHTLNVILGTSLPLQKSMLATNKKRKYYAKYFGHKISIAFSDFA